MGCKNTRSKTRRPSVSQGSLPLNDHPIATPTFPKVESAFGRRVRSVNSPRTKASRLQEEVTCRRSTSVKTDTGSQAFPRVCLWDNVSQRPANPQTPPLPTTTRSRHGASNSPRKVCCDHLDARPGSYSAHRRIRLTRVATIRSSDGDDLRKDRKQRQSHRHHICPLRVP